jgi:hypothetical protein
MAASNHSVEIGFLYVIMIHYHEMTDANVRELLGYV